jgi:hypothetical protein
MMVFISAEIPICELILRTTQPLRLDRVVSHTPSKGTVEVYEEVVSKSSCFDLVFRFAGRTLLERRQILWVAVCCRHGIQDKV